MSASDFDDDDDWRPPTDAELKVLEARRERSDKISKIMGQYLLKGHKMLDQTCPRCNCILLQLKGSSDLHCVSCIDLDSETKKDDPALNLAAANATVNEGNLRVSNEGGSTSELASPPHTSLLIPQQETSTKIIATAETQSHQESVEEHSGSCAMPLESLTRSQLTAVHDIPGCEALPAFTNNIPSTSNMTTQLEHGVNHHLSHYTFTSLQTEDSIANVLIGAKTSLTQTIAILTQQLNDLNAELRECPKNSSKLNSLLDLVTKYSNSLSAVLQTYNQLADT